VIGIRNIIMSDITDIVGKIQYRVALAGGWIDQPFMSKLNPTPPGCMVVAAVVPEFRFMDRAGICGSTRSIALDIWGDKVPDGDPSELVKELYNIENEGNPDPSGSQDMIGIVYPGISRLDYDFDHEGGYFPVHVESCNDPVVGKWLGENLYLVPVNTRPDGYYPLDRKNFSEEWAGKLGQTGKDCYDAIVNMDVKAFGASLNDCMECWYTLLPDTLEHHTIKIDLIALLKHYQATYAGAMYSGCGGGYLYVASDKPVPGGFQVKIKTVQ
jgi:hypothetical protein